jgi:methanogenic corrinoid protein MtbC1
MSIENNIKALREAIFDGEVAEAVEAVKQAVGNNADAALILKDAILPAINDMGDSMAEGDFFMPEVKISAKALKEVVGVFKPYVLAQRNLDDIDVPPWTGEGDIDDIGAYLMAAVTAVQDQSVEAHAGFFIMIANGLDTHEFTPCKIQGTEAADK